MNSKTFSSNLYSNNKSYNKSFAPLPVIIHPITSMAMSNKKIKDKIIDLKKELNKKIDELNELKIAITKLESEKETNKKILDKAIIESKTTEKPIELSADPNTLSKDMTISTTSYTRLKHANTISSLKQQVSLAQKQLKQRDEEIEELKSDSKVVKLLEKNSQLLEILNQTSVISKQIDSLNSMVIEKENKTQEDINRRDRHKAKQNALKSDFESLKVRYKKSLEKNEQRNQKTSAYIEKANNLKFQYNTSKQTERDIDNEIRFYEEQFATEGKLMEDKDRNNEEYKRYAKEIQCLNKEIKEKEDEIKILETENNDCVSILEREENRLKKFKANENSQIDTMKKEIIQKRKDIQELKEENQQLLNETNLLTINLQNKVDNVIKKKCEICLSIELTFIQKALKKKEKGKTLFCLNGSSDIKTRLSSSPNKNKLRLSNDNANETIGRIPNKEIKEMNRINTDNTLQFQKTITMKEEPITSGMNVFNENDIYDDKHKAIIENCDKTIVNPYVNDGH